MKRREAITGVFLVFGSALATRLQSAPGRERPRVVLVMSSPQDPDTTRFVEVFRQAMKERGYAQADYELVVRYYGGDRARLLALTDEVVAAGVDVIVANVSSTALVLRQKTASIPIVMAASLDAVEEGLVRSLPRPGGNVTGMTSVGRLMYPKLVELARELLPRAKRIALLLNPDHATAKAYERAAADAARSLKLEMTTLAVRNGSEIEAFARRLAALHTDALLVATDGVLFRLRKPVVQAASDARVPTIAILPEYLESGALATLGWDLAENYRGASRYVDRILKGANPADLAVEQPTQFQLLVNMKCARALGISIPQTILARADRVIE